MDTSLPHLTPKRKNSDDGNSDIPTGKHKVFPLSGKKLKVLDLIIIIIKSYAEVGKIYAKNESSSSEIVK